MGSYVGIDLHRQRSVIAVLNDDGDRVSWCRIDNTPANLATRDRRRRRRRRRRWRWKRAGAGTGRPT